MKRITERDRILTVAERWDAQYSINIEGVPPRPSGDTARQISERLHKLNLKKVKASTVNKVIGNDEWTRVLCEECEKDVEQVVALYGWSENTAIEICESCLNLAKRVIQGKVQ
jgi:hypothetical protein